MCIAFSVKLNYNMEIAKRAKILEFLGQTAPKFGAERGLQLPYTEWKVS